MEKAILGKWETDQEHGKNKGFEEYHIAIGLDDKVREQFSTIRDTLEYVQDGDNITCNVIIGGNVLKTYTGIQKDKEVTITGVDGKPCLFCYRIENGIWVETYKPGDGKGVVVETTKVVKGNKLTITHTVKGKGVTYSYTATKQ
ncbi:uncharacterized protein LOC110450284 [Mizuhopecten yessoensis]|uniref:Uncharacterized protein n=1 Tax=Mizuhopecten yessoensis TaxID=6573 RepID=A0A210QPA4_MIZYE|nr:uncharacterized protein LOC110450284 [Mizuhopecten yessoensis]OWF50570.1 hypothetical protein KP79_PYT18285 [Mizuhopecten yessoensis]